MASSDVSRITLDDETDESAIVQPIPSLVCSRCMKPKPATADFFKRDAKAPGGIQSICLQCNRALCREHFKRFRSR